MKVVVGGVCKIEVSHSCRGRVIAYGCLIRKGARREHLDYIYRGLMSHHQRATLICDKKIESLL